MDESVAKDQSTARPTSRLLRYPLRSAIKSRDEKPPVGDASNSGSVTRRGKNEPSVSKSLNILDVSGKEKSLNKPPRRLSVTAKSITSPAQRSIGNVTPVSDVRMRPASTERRSATPYSDVSNRRRDVVITSASYWLSQIRLSESASKHSISLGFFKLAFEAGCEPIQRMAEEFKSYARIHDLTGLEETTKSLFEMYGIINESIQSAQVSATISESHGENNETSSDPRQKPKPEESSDNTVNEVNQSENAKVEVTQEVDSVRKSVRSEPKKSVAAASEKGRTAATKPRKQIRQEQEHDTRGNMKKLGKKSASTKETVNSKPEGTAVQENKENSVNASA